MGTQEQPVSLSDNSQTPEPSFDIYDPAFEPLTVDSLKARLREAGLAARQTVIVHTSMRQLGWIVGGPVAVIRALREVLTPRGTLMMPAYSTDNTEPSHWKHPAVPENWWQQIRDHMPAFDPAETPSRALGRTAELFRNLPGVVRSNHPQVSFAALGPNAEYLTKEHSLDQCLGERSPLGRLYELDRHVLLLGVRHDSNSSLHLAEHRAKYEKSHIRQGAAISVAGKRQWVEFSALKYEDSDFAAIGEAFETETGFSPSPVGRGMARLIKQRPIVDFAVAWMDSHRA